MADPSPETTSLLRPPYLQIVRKTAKFLCSVALLVVLITTTVQIDRLATCFRSVFVPCIAATISPSVQVRLCPSQLTIETPSETLFTATPPVAFSQWLQKCLSIGCPLQRMAESHCPKQYSPFDSSVHLCVDESPYLIAKGYSLTSSQTFELSDRLNDYYLKE